MTRSFSPQAQCAEGYHGFNSYKKHSIQLSTPLSIEGLRGEEKIESSLFRPWNLRESHKADRDRSLNCVKHLK